MPDVEHWLAVIATDGINLTPWEEDFIASIAEQVAERGSDHLSERQIEIVERIYTERTPN